jgi:hypothetical protein
MSLEEALAANTAALDRNTAALTGAAGAAKGRGKSAATAAETVLPAQTPAPVLAATPAAQPAATVPYKEVADACSQLALKKGRDAFVQLLAKFGATKLPEVKADQLAAFKAEAIALTIAPAAAAPAPAGADLI